MGGVITASQTLMLIIPDGDLLVAEARVSPGDIDQIYVDQPVYVRLTALNPRTTPEVSGKVQRVSADLLTDSRTGTQYFTARIQLTASDLGNLSLIPGMPIETYFRTQSNSVIGYFMKPLTDNFRRVFRER